MDYKVTVSTTIEIKTLERLDRLARKARLNRSAFIRAVLEETINKDNQTDKEEVIENA